MCLIISTFICRTAMNNNRRDLMSIERAVHVGAEVCFFIQFFIQFLGALVTSKLLSSLCPISTTFCFRKLNRPWPFTPPRHRHNCAQTHRTTHICTDSSIYLKIWATSHFAVKSVYLGVELECFSLALGQGFCPPGFLPSTGFSAL